MRTTVIPAQITTVEDKIAGNLSMVQIVILLVPIFVGTLIFALVPPTMHLVWYKLPPAIFVLLVCLILSLRIKGKVVASWLGVLLSYNMRPTYYVFNKNDIAFRDILEFSRKEKKETIKSVVKNELAIPAKRFSIKELQELEAFIKNPNYSFSLKPGKKGGLYVVASEIKK